MAEKPILFNGEMVRAVLAGKKTQTRRIIKPQPDEDGLSKLVHGPWTDTSGVRYKCPYGIPGDLLYVRERHTLTNHGDPVYAADCRDSKGYHWSSIASDPTGVKWRPSIHHKREHCRILLEVVSVRVERVNHISEDDAMCEGIPKAEWGDSEITAFARLWDSINKKRGHGWETNPWVWVVEFKMLNAKTEGL